MTFQASAPLSKCVSTHFDTLWYYSDLLICPTLVLLDCSFHTQMSHYTLYAWEGRNQRRKQVNFEG